MNLFGRDERAEVQPHKLSLKQETLRQLTPGELKQAAGGWLRPPLSWSCPQPAPSSSNCPKQP